MTAVIEIATWAAVAVLAVGAPAVFVWFLIEHRRVSNHHRDEP